MEQEDFINKVLNSVNGITKVTPSDGIFQRIENKIQESQISTRTLWLVAASIVVLISLNIVLLKDKTNFNDLEMSSLERVINKNNQIYK